MIRILDGVPGSGKSYHAVEAMVEDLRRGDHVVTNLPVNWEAVKAYCAKPRPGLFKSRPGVILEDSQFRKLTEEETQFFYKHMPEGTLEAPVKGYFDELQNLFNARNWSTNAKLFGDSMKFLSHHRHYHTDLTLLTQDRSNIDAQFRRMCAEFWEHRDMNKFPLIGRAWPFKQFLRIRYGQDEDTVMERRWPFKNPEIYQLYDSHNKVDGIRLKPQVTRLQLVEAKPTLKQQIATQMKTWIMLAAIVLCAGWWGYSKFAKSSEGPNKSAGSYLTGKPGSGGGSGAAGGQGGQGGAASVTNVVTPGSTASQAGVVVSQDAFARESLRYAEGNFVRRTDKMTYILGRECPYGMVEYISDDWIKVRRPDKSFLFVYLDGGVTDYSALVNRPVGTSVAPQPVQPVTNPAAVLAEAKQIARNDSLSARESARISASARESISPTGRPANSRPNAPGQR